MLTAVSIIVLKSVTKNCNDCRDNHSVDCWVHGARIMIMLTARIICHGTNTLKELSRHILTISSVTLSGITDWEISEQLSLIVVTSMTRVATSSVERERVDQRSLVSRLL